MDCLNYYGTLLINQNIKYIDINLFKFWKIVYRDNIHN